MEKRFFNVIEPVTLNCWKHHLLFLRETASSSDPDELEEGLKRIGSSQMDLYTGKLTPLEISREVISTLEDLNTAEKEAYYNWLNNSGGRKYKLITLKDGSIWTLRYIRNYSSFVHLHPARYSPLTIRIKASTLKTAMIYACKYKSFGRPDIEDINRVRKEYLNLPPVHSAGRAEGLIKAVNLFYEDHSPG